MGAMTNILVIMFCINIALSIGGFSGQLGNTDVLSKFLVIGNDTVTGKTTVTPTTTLNGSIPTTLESGTIGNNGFSFIDALKMLFGTILFLFAIIFFPIYWAVALGFPSWLIMLFIPYQIIYLVSLWFFVRGTPP